MCCRCGTIRLIGRRLRLNCKQRHRIVTCSDRSLPAGISRPAAAPPEVSTGHLRSCAWRTCAPRRSGSTVVAAARGVLHVSSSRVSSDTGTRSAFDFDQVSEAPSIIPSMCRRASKLRRFRNSETWKIYGRWSSAMLREQIGVVQAILFETIDQRTLHVSCPTSSLFPVAIF